MKFRRKEVNHGFTDKGIQEGLQGSQESFITSHVQRVEDDEKEAASLWSSKTILIIALFFAVGPGLVGVIAAGLVEHFLGAWSVTDAGQMLILVCRFGLIWPAVLLYVRWVEKMPLSSIGFRSLPGWPVWAVGVSAVAIISDTAGQLAGRIVQAGAEELVCRGWLFHRMTEAKGRRAGIVTNAGVFVLIHLANPGVNPLTILNLILFSLLMSWLTVRSGLRASIVVHAIWNWGVGL